MPSALFAPITLRELTVRNRLWVSPMCQYSAEAGDGVPTSWHLLHYGSFARGGAGAVLVEATAVLPEGRISPQDLGLWNEQQREAFTAIVDVVHDHGAAIGVQLAHAGRKASTYRAWDSPDPGGSAPTHDGGWPTVGPSAQAFGRLAAPSALDQRGIDEVIAAFAAAARRAVDVGFDLLEVHGAHGYLVHQFLSPFSNDRTDSYGGSLENRARLLLQIVEAVRAEVGAGIPLLVRLSGTEWVDGGFDLAETVTVSGWLAQRAVDAIDLSSGGNLPGAPIPVGPGYQVPLATAVKQSVGLPVAAVGLITNAEQAEQIVATGLADIVLAGREFLRDPSFALRAAHELGAETDDVPAQYRRAYLNSM